MSKKIDRVGRTYGRLIVMAPAEKCTSGSAWWCVCGCGQRVRVSGCHLQSGHTTSCGCGSSRKTLPQRNTTHGRSGTPEHRAWKAMWMRCTNSNNPDFKHWGGRGIYVCKRWVKFENFLADMGARPSPAHSVGRKDNNKWYSPKNCRWETRAEQNSNTRRTVWLTFLGKRMPMVEVAKAAGIGYSTLSRRLRRGISLDRALLSCDLRGSRADVGAE